MYFRAEYLINFFFKKEMLQPCPCFFAHRNEYLSLPIIYYENEQPGFQHGEYTCKLYRTIEEPLRQEFTQSAPKSHSLSFTKFTQFAPWTL